MKIGTIKLVGGSSYWESTVLCHPWPRVRNILTVSYRGQNYIEKDLKGNENWFKLVGGSSYWESTVLCHPWPMVRNILNVSYRG